jgi:hypothetical protein
MGQQTVLIVEVKHYKDFTLQPGHTQVQPVASGICGGERNTRLPRV